MPSREPTPDDFPAECEVFEITAMQPIEPGTYAQIVITCPRADLVKTRASIKEMGYKIMFMVGKRAKPSE